MKNLDAFLIDCNDLLLNALKKINANKKGFLVVLKNGKFEGTLTDGDIRRSLISGKQLNSSIDGSYTKDSVTLFSHDNFYDAIDIFKEGRISFVPVLSEEKVLVNIITKGSMHVLLLQEIYPDLDYDFLSVDETLAEHEIYGRPWGFYKTTLLNESFRSKIISVRPKQSLSLQQHNLREEHWLIAKGQGVCRVDDKEFVVKAGDSIFIPKKSLHRIKNDQESDTLIILELQIGEYFGEDDIIRFEDEYGRI